MQVFNYVCAKRTTVNMSMAISFMLIMPHLGIAHPISNKLFFHTQVCFMSNAFCQNGSVQSQQINSLEKIEMNSTNLTGVNKLLQNVKSLEVKKHETQIDLTSSFVSDAPKNFQDLQDELNNALGWKKFNMVASNGIHYFGIVQLDFQKQDGSERILQPEHELWITVLQEDSKLIIKSVKLIDRTVYP